MKKILFTTIWYLGDRACALCIGDVFPVRYKVAIHAGFKPFITGIVYMLIGVVLVGITIALGG